MRDKENTEPQLDLRLPATAEVSERVAASVVIRNTMSSPILLVELRLSSAQGLIESWGINGRVMRWGGMALGRITGNRVEMLLGTEQLQQRPGPPSPLRREANAQLVRFEPLMPGAEVEVSTYVNADDRHGDRMDATLEYITLDPKTQKICAAPESSEPLSFVECRTVTSLEQQPGVHLYLPADELKRDLKTVKQSATLKIERPKFDVDAARERAGVASGPSAYDKETGSWFLFDEQANRTRVVGEQGIVEDLPGEWIQLLTAVKNAGEVSLTWKIDALPLTDDARQSLSDAGISVAPFTHKGYTRPDEFLVTINRIQIGTLARVLKRLGGRIEGLVILK